MRRHDTYRVYVSFTFISSALFALAFTAMSLYEVSTARLSPLQLVLVGTVLEASVFIFEIPTGIVADVYSRRLSIIIGQVLMGLGFLVEGLFPFFLPILLAQVLWGTGYTFTSGATQAWLSDEIGEERANHAFLTGNRLRLTGSLCGMVAVIVLGAFMPVAGLIVTSGVGRLVLAIALIVLMAETGFHPTRSENRNTWQHMADILRKGIRTVQARPALLSILGVGLFYGLYSEGLDRLWVKHLLDWFSLPGLFAQNQVAFFSLLDAASLLVSIGATALVEKRVDTRQPRAIGRLMLGLTAGIATSILAFAWAPLLGVALGAYLLLSGLRNVVGPLTDAWVNQRLDSDVRATILSMSSQVDSMGQVAGGPAIGLLANAVSVSLAISVSGALLTPALGLILRANRRTEPHAGESAPDCISL
jgi:MFS transporter, DHA3 family, tetracycline resistance protein